MRDERSIASMSTRAVAAPLVPRPASRDLRGGSASATLHSRVGETCTWMEPVRHRGKRVHVVLFIALEVGFALLLIGGWNLVFGVLVCQRRYGSAGLALASLGRPCALLRASPEFPAAADTLVDAGLAIALFVRDRCDTRAAAHAGLSRQCVDVATRVVEGRRPPARFTRPARPLWDNGRVRIEQEMRDECFARCHRPTGRE